MSQSTPVVEVGYLDDPAPPGARIALDSPAWFAWLEQLTARRFSYALFDPTRGDIVGFVTGRKEARKEARQRGGSYWVAYRRWQGRLRKVYLGRSSAVPHARLQGVVRVLCDVSAAPPLHTA